MGERKGIWIKIYSDSIYVRGRTYPIKEELKRMGFRFGRDGHNNPFWERWFDDIGELEEILERIKPDNEEEIRKKMNEIKKALINRSLLELEKIFKRIMESERREKLAEAIKNEFKIYSIPELRQRIKYNKEEREKFISILAEVIK